MTSLACHLLAAASPLASPQGAALTEDFNGAIPPPGWVHEQVNPAAAGWQASGDGRAWHQDEGSAVGTCDDLLISPVFSLAGHAAAYAHFEIQLQFADYLANHPNSRGDGETDLYVRVAGGAWTEAWTETRTGMSNDVLTVDLTALAAGAAAVEIGFRYYGTFAHETWVDWVQVDGDPLPPPPPPPPPVSWTVNLPGAFAPLPAGATLTDDFESYGGALPPHMAATSVFPSSGMPDPDGWCTIAGGTVPAASGARCLEMGLRPGAINYHFVRNALVLGYDGTGTNGLRSFGFTAFDHGEELHAIDGAWLSQDGLSWYQVYGPWAGLPAAWTPLSADVRALQHLTLGTFYLMLAQEDNFPYAQLDGVGVDDLMLEVEGGPTPPVLTRVGACPGTVQFTVSGAAPNADVALLYGRAGSFVQSNPNYPCVGVALDLRRPFLYATMAADANGTLTFGAPVPAQACGFVIQAVDLARCLPSNALTL